MDLKRYLQVSARRWWVVLLAVLVTGGATAYRVMPLPDEYESRATFVVRPNETLAGDEIRAIDTLIRGGSINATYASIARSRLIRDRALERMEPGTVARGLRARAEVVAGTNILAITVRNEDPELAHAFLEAVSEETVGYVQTVDEAYRLEPLDPPSMPSEPVDARTTLTIALGVMLGLAVGVGLAMLIEYLRSPSSGQTDRATLDDDIAGDGPTDNGAVPNAAANGTTRRRAARRAEATRVAALRDTGGDEAADEDDVEPELVIFTAAADEFEVEPERVSVAAAADEHDVEPERVSVATAGALASGDGAPREGGELRVTHRERLSNGHPMPAVVKDWNGVARVIRTFGTKNPGR